jgi:hypothetical protein
MLIQSRRGSSAAAFCYVVFCSVNFPCKAQAGERNAGQRNATKRYAGSVTAAVADAIFAEGRSMACLYVDLRNPYSRRCYAKIGFTPVCRSWYCPRVSGLASGLSAKV